MQYEDALRAWGISKLQETHPGKEFQLDTVSVSVDIDPGYTCDCGSDDCYGSYNTPAGVLLFIEGRPTKGPWCSRTMNEYFEFGEFIRELLVTADGTVTLD